MLSSALAVTLTFSTFGSVPVAAYVQENDITQEDDVGEQSQSTLADISEPLSMDSMFSNIGDANMSVDEALNTVTLEKSGDHFTMYNGCEKVKAFTWEADVNLLDNGISAGLVIADDKENPSSRWYGANINTNETYAEGTDNSSTGRFRVFGPDNFQNQHPLWEGLDTTKALHLKLSVKTNGDYTYTFGNVDSELKSLSGTIPNWNGGYIGILTYNTKATFSNIKFNEKYNTNLTGLNFSNGTWEVTDEGLYSNAVDKGDCFMYSTATGTNFVYSTDVTFKDNVDSAAALVFRNASQDNARDSYVVNLNAKSKKYRFYRWDNGDVYDLIDEKEIKATGDKYTLKVVAIGSWISYYVNDELVASTGDYTLQEGNRGQKTFLNNGYLGLLNFNGEMVFQNTYYSELTDNLTPLLDDIKITSSTGTVEKRTQFVPTEPITIQYVDNNAETVDVNVTKKVNLLQ